MRRNKRKRREGANRDEMKDVRNYREVGSEGRGERGGEGGGVSGSSVIFVTWALKAEATRGGSIQVIRSKLPAYR